MSLPMLQGSSDGLATLAPSSALISSLLPRKLSMENIAVGQSLMKELPNLSTGSQLEVPPPIPLAQKSLPLQPARTRSYSLSSVSARQTLPVHGMFGKEAAERLVFCRRRSSFASISATSKGKERQGDDGDETSSSLSFCCAGTDELTLDSTDEREEASDASPSIPGAEPESGGALAALRQQLRSGPHIGVTSVTSMSSNSYVNNLSSPATPTARVSPTSASATATPPQHFDGQDSALTTVTVKPDSVVITHFPTDGSPDGSATGASVKKEILPTAILEQMGLVEAAESQDLSASDPSAVRQGSGSLDPAAAMPSIGELPPDNGPSSKQEAFQTLLTAANVSFSETLDFGPPSPAVIREVPSKPSRPSLSPTIVAQGESSSTSSTSTSSSGNSFLTAMTTPSSLSSSSLTSCGSFLSGSASRKSSDDGQLQQDARSSVSSQGDGTKDDRTHSLPSIITDFDGATVLTDARAHRRTTEPSFLMSSSAALKISSLQHQNDTHEHQHDLQYQPQAVIQKLPSLVSLHDAQAIESQSVTVFLAEDGTPELAHQGGRVMLPAMSGDAPSSQHWVSSPVQDLKSLPEEGLPSESRKMAHSASEPVIKHRRASSGLNQVYQAKRDSRSMDMNTRSNSQMNNGTISSLSRHSSWKTPSYLAPTPSYLASNFSWRKNYGGGDGGGIASGQQTPLYSRRDWSPRSSVLVPAKLEGTPTRNATHAEVEQVVAGATASLSRPGGQRGESSGVPSPSTVTGSENESTGVAVDASCFSPHEPQQQESPVVSRPITTKATVHHLSSSIIAARAVEILPSAL